MTGGLLIESARAAIYKKIAAADIVDPDNSYSSGFIFSVNCSYDDDRKVVTDTDRTPEPGDITWLLMLVRHIDRHPTSLSGRRLEVTGVVLADVRTQGKNVPIPLDVLRNRSVQLAVEVARVFDVGKLVKNYVPDSPTIYFGGSSVHERGVEGKWYLTQVRAPFTYYEQLVKP